MKKRRRKKKSPALDLIKGTGNFVLKVIPPAVMACAVVLALGGMRKSLFADHFFRVDNVKIETDGILSAKEVARLSGIREGNNILEIDLEQVAKRLLQDSRIQGASVQRSLPDILQVKIRERHAFLRLRMKDWNGAKVVDQEGVLIGSDEKFQHLILFEDFRESTAIYPPYKRYREKKLLASVFQIKEAFQNDPLFQGNSLKKITVYAPHKIFLSFQEGPEVRITEEWEEELKKVEMLRSQLQNDFIELEYLDLRFQDVISKKRKSNGG